MPSLSRAPEAVPTRIVQLETGGLLAALIQARLYLKLCEEGRARNSGMQRVSPGAQSFVYDEWLKAIPDFEVATDEPLMERGGGNMMALFTLPLAWEVTA